MKAFIIVICIVLVLLILATVICCVIVGHDSRNKYYDYTKHKESLDDHYFEEFKSRHKSWHDED